MTDTTKQAIEAHYEYKKFQSEGTAKEYKRAVELFHTYLTENTDATLFDCNSGHIERFYQYLIGEGYAPNTVRKCHSGLSDFYQQLNEFGGERGFPDVTVEQIPTENARVEQVDGMFRGSKMDMEGGDTPLTKEEVRQLVENVPPNNLVRNTLIVRLLYQTGIRRSELVRIKLDHIDREDRSISIYGKKTEESRKVWYKPSLDTLLDLWIDGDRNAVFYAEQSDYLFPTRRQERMSGQTVSDIVIEAGERAGIQETIYHDYAGHPVRRVTPHILRKTFGVHFIKDGGDISFLMELLGHNDIETTKENYLNYVEKDIKQSVRRHGPSL